MRLGLLLKRHRTIGEINIRALARDIGILPSTLSRLENGKLVDGVTLAKVLVWVLGRTSGK